MLTAVALTIAVDLYTRNVALSFGAALCSLIAVAGLLFVVTDRDDAGAGLPNLRESIPLALVACALYLPFVVVAVGLTFLVYGLSGSRPLEVFVALLAAVPAAIYFFGRKGLFWPAPPRPSDAGMLLANLRIHLVLLAVFALNLGWWLTSRLGGYFPSVHEANIAGLMVAIAMEVVNLYFLRQRYLLARTGARPASN
jgi:hypothetical protein